MDSVQHDSCSHVKHFLHDSFRARNTGRVLECFSMDYKKLVAKRLRAARLALPRRDDGELQSQADIAAMVAGLTEQALGNYEQGTRLPKPDMMMKLAEALNEPAAYLAGLIPDGPLADLVRAFNRMDEDDKRDVLDTALRRKSLKASELKDFGVIETPKPGKRKTQ